MAGFENRIVEPSINPRRVGVADSARVFSVSTVLILKNTCRRSPNLNLDRASALLDAAVFSTPPGLERWTASRWPP
jgi:hypothetical protein